MSNLNRPFSDHPGVLGAKVGIELEFENATNPVYADNLRDWLVTHDHSLRNGVEYVSRVLTPREVPAALRLCYDRVTKYRLKPSVRCGVHVHMNIQDLTYNQLMRYIMLYVLLEPYIFEEFAKDRIDNHFCVPLFANTDMYGFFSKLSKYMRSGANISAHCGRASKYSALNFAAIYKLGTLEFRHLEAQSNPDFIGRWIRFLIELRRSALNQYDTPEDILKTQEKYGTARLTTGLGIKINSIPDEDYQEAAIDLAYLLCGQEQKHWKEMNWKVA